MSPEILTVMDEKLIGRKKEQLQLQRCLDSSQSELVVIYGRRRIGKTFLVRQFFNNRFSFCYVGAHHFSQREQLASFAEALKVYGHLPLFPQLNSWVDAFNTLQAIIEAIPTNKKKVLFFDEMPWIDNTRLSFVKALENFWNGWVASRNDILLVACGSATSWMVDKLFNNKGGLHNRITERIKLAPFTLEETESYLRNRGFTWDRYTIVQCYMVLGGVPFYLSKLDPGLSLSLPQHIDRLFFDKNAPMKNEFEEMFNALFSHAEKYITIAKLLARHREGMTPAELSKESGITGGWLTRILNNLMQSDFMSCYSQYGNKSKGQIYRICDFFTLFYFKYIENNHSRDIHFWEHSLMASSVAAWQGITFELIVLQHLEQVKKALGVDRILNSSSSWRSRDIEERTQIDLVIERADRVINLCEIKFSSMPFIITKDYEMTLRRRMAIFQNQTRTRKTLVTTLITTYGVSVGTHSGVVQSQVTMDDLFV